MSSSEPKFPKPEPFTAEGDLYTRVKNANEFLAKCQLYFANTQGFKTTTTPATGTGTTPTVDHHDKSRTSYALSLCRESAFLWARTFIKHIDVEPATATPEQAPFTTAIHNWAKWQEVFITQFASINEDQAARRKLENLRYEGSISTFTSTFTDLSYETGWNDKSKMDKLETKLPEFILKSI